MTKPFLFVPLALAFAASLAGAQAEAQTRGACAARTDIVKRLSDRYGETLQSMGLQNNGILEIYASDDTGTWTIVVTTPDGRACLLAAGQLWEPDAASLSKPGDDA